MGEQQAGFDAVAFFVALDEVRGSRGVTWRTVAGESGVGPSTLTRLSQEKRPDVDSLARLVNWAGLRADDFLKRTTAGNEAPMAMISSLLRGDKNLTPEAATALETVLKATYEALRADPTT